MRQDLIRSLSRLADEDARIVLLTGDIGFMVVEPFAERFRERFFNVGVAEQNMLGLATGLAEAGLRPFVYSIATFVALRAFEFIRNGPALNRLPVAIIGVGGGFDYAHQGATHHALEDIAVLRAIPGITVVAPADGAQLASALQAGRGLDGPIYYRVGKNNLPAIDGLDGKFGFGRAEKIRCGDDVCLVVTGTLTGEAVAAAEILAQQGIAVTILVAACLAPAPVDDIVRELGTMRLAVTVEAHSVIGGLGSLVAEAIAEHGLQCRLLRCGVREFAQTRNGSQAFLHRLHGLDAESIARRIAGALG